MLESIRIQNFRCLRDVTLELGPFTVFVGPNASGKSAIADALTVKLQYSQTQKYSIPRDCWRKKEPPTWSVAPSIDIPSRTPDVLGENRYKYTLNLQHLRQPQVANEAWSLTQTGSSLANLFSTLSRPEQEKFVETFNHLVPMYSDIKVRPKDGKNRIQFLDRWQSDLWYESDEVSDGTMFIAALVALSFQRDMPTLVVIEDPDQGLHPYVQRPIAEMLRKLSNGDIGSKPIQIVCTTHSRAFLDCLKPEEVRFIRRNRHTGETEIEAAPLDSPNWQRVYDHFQNSLGSMWMTGSLGGVPGI